MSDLARPRSSKGGRATASTPWDLPDPRGAAGERGPWVATSLSLFFLLGALLALAFVPAYLNTQVAQVQEQIQEVLGPAEQLAAEIELAQTRRLAALEAFLYSGDPDFRQRYREAEREERRLYDTLQPLARGIDLDVWQLAVRVRDRSRSWHLGLEDVLNEEVSRQEFLQRWNTERARFDDLLLATRSLRDALAVETRLQLSEMARRREAQTLISRILIFGLLAPLAALFSVGWRLRTLMRESEALRWAATRARREADALLAATGDGVLGMDRDGRCRFLNRAGAELLGYPARSVAGKDVHGLLHHTRADGTPYPREECVLLQALDTGLPVSGRNEILWTAGNVFFPVQVSVRPLKEGGTIRGAVLTFTDMTETRAAEESLRQAIRARDEVLAVVSHDLRNPVGTIFSSASLLLELKLSEEKQRDQLMSVKRAAARMNRLIQDLLDVARMEAGALRVAVGHFRLGELLDEIVLTHRESARTRGVHLQSRSPDAAAQGWGDRDRVHQVLSNLVENALKFSGKGGVVEVGAREEPEEDGVLFWVSDTGPGIDEADRERLFDRFWQVSRRDKRGAGLGLSIVKGLVEAHGGRVWVESEEGVGTTFLFLLPDPKPETLEPSPTVSGKSL
jgi:PAS domain S-box-containing protein